jgi:alpha-ribazole phosphatase
MIQLTLLRHTTTACEPGCCYGGGSELALAESFEAEAQFISRHLSHEFTHYHSSPLQRCQRLARHLFPHVAWKLDEHLAEIHFGEWEGQRWEALAGPILDAWMQDFIHVRPPGGESTLDLVERVQSFLVDLTAQGQEGTHLAITHGGFIRTLLATVLGLPLENMFQLEVPCASIVQLSYRHQRWHLEKLLPVEPVAKSFIQPLGAPN